MTVANIPMRQSKWTTLVALVAVFVLPMLMDWFLNHYQPFEHCGVLGHAELLPPPQRFEVPSLSLGQWTLLYHVSPQAMGGANSSQHCDSDCMALIDTLHRVRLAQGKSTRHEQRVLVEPITPSRTVVGTADHFDNELKIVTTKDSTLPAGSVYLVDSQGYLVLRYRPGFDPKGQLKRLQRLLRLSGEE